jgi:hypothetical protein
MIINRLKTRDYGKMVPVPYGRGESLGREEEEGPA